MVPRARATEPEPQSEQQPAPTGPTEIEGFLWKRGSGMCMGF